MDLMGIRFASSYIDRLFTERDMAKLYHLISLMERERVLPEEFWLFSRIQEWLGSTRSGVWQYYETLSGENFNRMHQALLRFDLAEVAEKYAFGRNEWNGPDRAASLDKWIWQHDRQIESAAFDLILQRKASLMSD